MQWKIRTWKVICSSEVSQQVDLRWTLCVFTSVHTQTKRDRTGKVQAWCTRHMSKLSTTYCTVTDMLNVQTSILWVGGLGGMWCLSVQEFPDEATSCTLSPFTAPNARTHTTKKTTIATYNKTASQYKGKYLCGASQKIIRSTGCKKIFFSLYHQRDEIHSFPAMYNTWGSSLGRNGSKKWFSKKKRPKNSFLGRHDPG